MTKTRTRFVCQKCGAEAPRWLGRCPDCGEWNSLLEEVVAPRAAGAGNTSGSVGLPSAGSTPQPIGSIPMESWSRTPSGIGEFDRVLGGGIVPGSLVLIGGDPGIGKSTLLMQASAELARSSGRTLYVTGEESAQQVKLRAERLDALAPELYLSAETDIDVIEAHTHNLKPRFLIIDSIQTVHDPAIGSAPATVSQVRTCCARLMRLAKSSHTTVFLVGHVTKEGTIAGPRVLEHMVDTVLYFEGDRFQSYRILRGVKNRFGSTDEIGLFEMTDAGLREVAGASELFLSQRPEQGPGSAVVAIIEGTRPLLVEVQALVARSFLASPRRTTTGIDYNRVNMILAVLEKRCGMRMSDKDVYVNVAGGLKVVEPAVDMGIAVALASSFRDRPVWDDLAVAGEVGLSGEVRSVHQTDRRLKEVARMGFKRAMVPGPRPRGSASEGLAVTE
ncbi:MAG TPA: DNA repair protein RadA, partial [Armatimonadota bacterium]|nr:DNA repair protein RadA [Armatimonadota bacterium]